MPRAFSVLAVAVAMLGVLGGINAVTAFSVPPSVVVSMDVPPEQRWIPALDAVLKIHSWEDSIGAVLAMYEPLMALLPADTGSVLAANIKKRDAMRFRELQGICAHATTIGHPLNVTTLSLFYYFYELMHITDFRQAARARGLPPIWERSCTGILSLPADPNAHIIHGRNMDESPHQGRNMTVLINVTKKGKLMYQIFDWTWITTGFFTSQRFGGVSLEQNWRNADTFSYETLLARLLDPTARPIVELFRHVQENEMGFDDAVAFLSSDVVIAPMYIIMSGTKRRGAILTIDSDANLTRREYLNDTSRVTFKVQTNYDRWLPDPSDDPRRTVAENTLTMVGRERSGTELGVWMALSVYPVHNGGTMYSVLMSAERPVAEGYIRVAMKPRQW